MMEGLRRSLTVLAVAASAVGLLAGPARAAGTTAHAFPVPAGYAVGYAHSHHDYPATDLIARCGTPALSPADGTVVQVRRTDLWDPKRNDPATRGGRYVTILGDDGVRYYLAHFAAVEAGIEPGVRVRAGQRIATVGQSGDARLSTCHIHLGLSLPCPTNEWRVRRGVVWPWRYLDRWRAGATTGAAASPAGELLRWASTHRGACAKAAADPTAAAA